MEYIYFVKVNMSQSDKMFTKYYDVKGKEINKNDLNNYSRFHVIDSNDSYYMVRNPNYHRDNAGNYSHEYRDEGEIITHGLDNYSTYYDENGNKYKQYKQYKRSLFGKSQNTDNESTQSSESAQTPFIRPIANELPLTPPIRSVAPAPAQPLEGTLIRPVAGNEVRQTKLPKPVKRNMRDRSQMSNMPAKLNNVEIAGLPSYSAVVNARNMNVIPDDSDDPVTQFVHKDIPLDDIHFESNRINSSNVSTNGLVNFSFDRDGKLSLVTIGNRKYNIGSLLGKSRAFVYEITSSNLKINTNMCLKIAEHGDISFTNKKLRHILYHPDDFIRVYDYISDVEFEENLTLHVPEEYFDYTFNGNVDICILERVDKTLDQMCDDLRNQEKGLIGVKAFSYKFLYILTQRLINIADNLVKNELCYTDIKAPNIGINIRDNQYSVKLIDVDTIDDYGELSTPYTSGRIARNINIIRIQYLNIFFTIFSLLFLDDYKTMCSPKYGKFYRGTKINDYMSWVNNDDQFGSWIKKYGQCSQYKYALLVGTYKIIEDGYNRNFNIIDITKDYYDIISRVYEVILNKGRCNDCNIVTDNGYNSYFFLFIAQCLVIMIAIFKSDLIKDNYFYVTNVINTLFKNPYKDDKTISVHEKYEDVMLDAETSIGVSIVNILRKYAVGYCMDDTCEALKAYGEHFLNIDSNGNQY